MKKLLCAGLILGAVVAGNISYGKDNLWKSYKGMYAPSSMEMIIKPNAYSLFTLDNASMKYQLSDVSSDFKTGKLISIPTPNGDMKTFRIWKNTTMSPELAAKYPEIQTFDGVDVNNPSVVAKFGFNMFGFSAYVIDGASTYIIDPYSNAGDGYYMAFYKNELPEEKIFCGVDEMMKATGIQDLDNTPKSFDFNRSGGTPPPPPYAHSAQQRKFRAAITNTGEWAVAIVGSSSPTKAQVLTKIVEIVNRINSYFEREIAVTLELIPNNDVLVFTNKDTDPYNYNSQMPNLLGESHDAIVNRVGVNNFDIGHILCTAGGGLAATPAVCSNSSKGRAASSVGTTSQVKVIMHEMGHQMNASHTFSSDQGGCNGNGMPQGAYESGSGVTIMSYNGACAGDNVPAAADDYYHVHSLYEITNHINNNITCGTLSTNIPVLTIPNVADTYYIPLNTPFELVGQEATVQGSQIKQTFLYNWEQYDNGFDFTEAQGSNQTTGPTLRSHDPKTSTIQAYPPPSVIISGTNGTYSTSGYRLPGVARVLNFKYIARGVVNGRGAFNFTDSTLKVISVANTGPFRVTSQNSSGTSNWNPGDNVEIKWDVANTNSAPINCQGVSIFLCFPNSSEPDILLVGYAPNTGSYVYPVQNFYARGGHIKVKGAGNIFFDVAKGGINVNGTNIDETTFSRNITIFPNPATEHINIKNENSHVKLNVVMFNVMGQKVWEGEMTNTLTIATNHLPAGNYQVQLQDAATKNVATHKVSIVK